MTGYNYSWRFKNMAPYGRIKIGLRDKDRNVIAGVDKRTLSNK
jgi:hypothetical protein